jgi:hypothetical protein
LVVLVVLVVLAAQSVLVAPIVLVVLVVLVLLGTLFKSHGLVVGLTVVSPSLTLACSTVNPAVAVVLLVSPAVVVKLW